MEENTIETRCGFVAIVGRPNVGKSTLLNKILGQKVSITSRKPQTTRHRILGIDTVDQYQTIYVDTPGLHSVEKRAINRLMNRAASSSLGNVEMVFFVVEGTHFYKDDEMVLNKLKNLTIPVILVINKIDQVQDKDSLLPFIAEMNQKMTFKEIIPISAVHGNNVQELRQIAQESLPPCEFIFPEDYITDRSSRFMASEIIREKLMRFTGDELPYSVTVEIENFKVDEKGICNIDALILVERDSQKKMVIGANGSKLKTVGTEARMDLERLFQAKVFLRTWVKVKSGWADDERALRSLGYIDNDIFSDK
jgi:GTP-binding protein Era